SNPSNIAEAVKESELVTSAVLTVVKKAPKPVTEEMFQSMKPGSVAVDIEIDHGGIFVTPDRNTLHDNPTNEKHSVVQYTVANMTDEC
ncbi:alanine dehydrogenase, partial [Bacillus cereus]|nr:alanine dehydrogenase [Bacillus cereus]